MSRHTRARSGTLAARAVAMGGPLWRSVRGSRGSSIDPGPYGPLGDPDGTGIALPRGFATRVIARSGYKSAGVVWHAAPDGGACFTDEDGWIYVSNSEASPLGGASAVRFGSEGTQRSAYRILSGTDFNGPGCATPWNTWLSCEEILCGRVFECDPYGSHAAMPRVAMGCFRHEALACDPDQRVVYLVEDEPDGCFYRFVPDDWGDLTTGTLQVLVSAGEQGDVGDRAGTAGGGTAGAGGMGGGVAAAGPVAWARVPNPAALMEPTRRQVAGARHFDRAAGCHYAGGLCYFTTGGDGRVWAYDAVNQRIETVHDLGELVATVAGDLFVAGNDRENDLETRAPAGMGFDVLTREGVAAPFLRVTGREGSEITGPAFSPDGRRLYFSSRRGAADAATGADGITYEVTGPFRA